MAHHPPRPSGKAAPSLHLAPPPADQPDNRVSVALALLGPINTWLDDQTSNAMADIHKTKDLVSDPRYVIGRLHQALTVLLADDVPAMDATAVQLGNALSDAIAYRQRTCAECGTEGICPKCWPNWRKADEYEALFGQLGLIAELPAPPNLTVVKPETAE